VLIAGVDEAGRGPLAGPVVAAAVILAPGKPLRGLRDSKQLTHERRVELAVLIRTRAVAWAVAHADVGEIETLNILWATMLAMQRAVAALSVAPHAAWIDGDRCPALACEARAFVNGDATHAAIAAASILAKTARDAMLVELDATYPHYGFAQHKGYATAAHRAALAQHGPCPAHRRTFASVTQVTLPF
jgi:ribonuclease HII